MNMFSKANHSTPINTVKPQHLFVAFCWSVDSVKEGHLDKTHEASYPLP